MITISKTHFTEIQEHSISCFPYECCGALFGAMQGDEKVVTEIKAIDNVSEEDQRRRFKITDADYQRLEKYAKDNNVSLLGFYHSHPNHPAKPSETDLNYAWPFFSYLIQSVYDKVPKELNSFELDPTDMTFVDEHITIS